jgi:hypothetical protein
MKTVVAKIYFRECTSIFEEEKNARKALITTAKIENKQRTISPTTTCMTQVIRQLVT